MSGDTLTFDEARAHVARYSYKPGSSIQLLRSAVGSMIQVAIPNKLVQDPTRDDIIVNTTFVMEPLTRESLDYTLAFAIESIEVHERDEWFRFDGRVVRNPHPEVDGYDKLVRRLDGTHV